MNKLIAHLGVKSGMLNYVDHETPRSYFLASWADEEMLEEFAELIIAECVDVMKRNEMLPVGYLQPKSADSHSTAILHHFGLNEIGEPELSDHAKWSIDNFGSPNGA